MDLIIEQGVSLLGAFLILLAYFMQNHGRLHINRLAICMLNILGSTALLIGALYQRNAGFIILQSSWLIISLVGLRKILTSKSA